MAENIEKKRVWTKVDTLENWNNNPLLLGPGEMALVTTPSGIPLNMKWGDKNERKRFSDLPFAISYDQGQFVIVDGPGELPTPESDVAYSLVGPGTYTYPGQSDIVVEEGHWGQVVYSDGEWSFVDMGELPQPDIDKTDTVVEPSELVTTETAVLRYAPKTTGKNLFNENTVVNDSAVNGSGEIVSGGGYAGWKRSDYIPVTQQPHYLSGERGTTRVSFFANEGETTAIRSFLFEGEGEITPQAGEQFVILNLTNATTSFSNVQLEEGSVKTEYEPFGGKIKREYLEGVSELSKEVESLEADSLKDEDLEIYASANRFTEESIWDDFYISTDQIGQPNPGVREAANWKISVVNIPATEPTGYVVIQNWGSVTKTISFYSNTDIVPGDVSNLQYSGRITDFTGEYEIDGNDVKIKYPVGSKSMAINIKSGAETDSVFSQLLIAFSADYIPYVPPSPIEVVKKIRNKSLMASALLNKNGDLVEVDDLLTKTDAVGTGNIAVVISGEDIAIRIPYDQNEDFVHRWQQKNANGVFNSLGVFSIGKGLPDGDILTAGTVVHNFTDNIAPIFFKTLSTATGNHGVALPIATVSSGHGKTEDDLFSIWSTPSNEYYLVEIMSDTQLRFLGRARSDGSMPRGITSTITHVSGGTNTDTINATSVTATEVNPAMRQDMIQSVVVDGRNITEDGVHKGEVVELVEISNVPDWREPTLEAPFDVTNAPTMIQNRIAYRYDKTNTLSIDYVMDFVRNFPIDYIGFFQSQIFSPTGRTRNDIYFPNSNVYGGRDFRTKVNLTSALGTDVIINNDNVENPDKPVQRCIQVATVDGVEKYGYAHGYAYNIGKSSQANRSDLYRQWELRGSSGKSYPRVLWDFNPDFDVLHVSAYCQYFDPRVNPEATAVYVHKEGDSYFVYIDFHQDLAKANIQLPDYIHGKKLEEVDVQGVELISGDVIPSTGIYVSSTLSNGYAYGIFKCV